MPSASHPQRVLPDPSQAEQRKARGSGRPVVIGTILISLFVAADLVIAEERTQRFDTDPGWESRNNRALQPAPRPVRQDFGYRRTNHAGGSPGEIGGFFMPSAEAAYYARRMPALDFRQPLRVSGKLACTGRQFHLLVGFFNSRTVNEWRTPNSIFLRLYGRGDVFYAYVEYATSRWRAGGDSPGGFQVVTDPDTGREQLRGFATQGKVHNWSLEYDPDGNRGKGSIAVRIDEELSICHLDDGHKSDGASFDRCGLLSIPKSCDDGGEVWFDDLEINGEKESFDDDPAWDAVGNRREYLSNGVRPRFDFGYSTTNFAGGAARGELGGVVFRGDCRDGTKMASYADRLHPLNLDQPLRMAGRLSLRRGVSDSTTLLGFFHSQDSWKVSTEQGSGFPRNFLGIVVEGPSSEGFFCYPAYRLAAEASGLAGGRDLPRILPDGAAHAWELTYDPTAIDGRGLIELRCEEKQVRLPLGTGHRQAGGRFDRFGIVTTWIDGNAQEIYFDDLRYTVRQTP